MIALNLTASGEEQTRIKDYLEKNVSEILADKINNGTKIVKDGKTLINRKTLEGFMKYACEEARKIAEKGARYACIEDKTVFGWAIHYFEEESIEEKLYNEDGTEVTPKPVKQEIKATVTPTPVKNKKGDCKMQASLFDFLDKPEETENEDEDTGENDDISDETEEVEEEPVEETKPVQKPVSPLYQKYMDIQKQYPDHVIAYRLGDFYEVFGDNAVKIANFLDLTLTGRDCGLEERVPMVGFPYHVCDNYFAKIIKKYPLAIVEDQKEIELLPTIEEAQKQLLLEEQTANKIDYETGEILEPKASNSNTVDYLNAIFDFEIIERY